MPAKESAAGTGAQTVKVNLTDVVLTSVTLRNPNVSNRAETSRILLYRGTKIDPGQIDYQELDTGWTNKTHSIHWSGNQTLQGDYILVGEITHASSVKHVIAWEVDAPKSRPDRRFWRWPASR